MKKNILIFAALAMAGSSAFAASASLSGANDLLLKQQYAEAASAFEEAGPQTPAKKEGWRLNNWGLALIRMEKAGQACTVLEKAVQADPKNFTAWANLGAAYENIGDKTKATDTYRRALELLSKETVALAAGKKAQDPDAIQNSRVEGGGTEVFSEPASVMKDTELRSALKRAADLLAEEKFQESADAYAKIGICSGAKREGWKLNNWGLALIRLGNHKEALPRLKKSVEVYPDNPKAWNNLGVAYENLDMPEEARQAYAKATGSVPGAEMDSVKVELNRLKLDFNTEKKRWEATR